MKVRFTPPGRHPSVLAMREHLQSIDPAFDCVDAVQAETCALGQPYTLATSEKGTRTIGNRFAVHPMEGWDAEGNGAPSELTRRRWHNFGRSGAKLIWGGEAFAVQADGRANPRQLYLNPEIDVERGLETLRSDILKGHQEASETQDDLYIGLQLTHSGRFARPVGPLEPKVAHRHPVLDEKFHVTSDSMVLSDGELEAIGERYVASAKAAQRAGFDFVDVKACHGYLLHEVLSARTRPGAYGGSFANRTALFRRIVEGIRTECPGLDIGVRVSIVDTFPHRPDGDDGIGAPVGWRDHVPFDFGFGVDRDDPRLFDLEEPVRFLQLLRDLDIRLANLSIGSPYYCPHVQRPAAYPPNDGYGPPEDPLKSVLRHLRVTRMCKEAVPELGLVGTGYTYLQEYLPHVAEHEVASGHVDFVGLGRMMLIYPELPRDVLAGRSMPKKKVCRTLSDCTTAPRNGMVSGCFPLDPFYKAMPEAQELIQVKKAQRSSQSR